MGVSVFKFLFENNSPFKFLYLNPGMTFMFAATFFFDLFFYKFDIQQDQIDKLL